MIDPDGIQIQRGNLPAQILIDHVPEFEYTIYNLDDEKDYNKYITDVERQVRMSYEYRQFTKFLRENFGMNKCAFLSGVSNEETYDIKIEIHHYPFSLHDIVEIVLRKRTYYQQSLDIQMVAKEVMQLHYKCVIGLIPLSETAHELTHASRLFIPSTKVFGRYDSFAQVYDQFCTDQQRETLERIEKYTVENTEVNDTSILDRNPVTFSIKDEEYVLPELSTVSNAMHHQLDLIKNNNYLLPTVDEVRALEHKKEIEPAIIFDEGYGN